ncbi:MAG: 2-dehydropantoate 2-reductase [Acidobacteria bacterium]|nr:2-dehydropantoate 2-reductase [Acidobacteriota bacterium]
MIRRVCIVGCGAIGSLYAAHLARVAEVHVLVRRREHAQSLAANGLRVSGIHDFHSGIRATCDVAELPPCDLAIVATKATQTAEALAECGYLFDSGAVLSAQNGLGGEEIIARHTRARVIRGTTFMSGTRHSDAHVQYELDTATWMGPFEPTATPFSVVQEAAELINRSGLRAEALPDARPAQWAKVIFNSSVNAVSALTDLPHCPAFADEQEFCSLGHLLHALIEEGKRVAAAAGIVLHADPWKMNCVGAQTNHPPSMLADVRKHVRTEVDFLGGAIAREAERFGVPAPLHSGLYRLIKGKEAGWTFDQENRPAAARGVRANTDSAISGSNGLEFRVPPVDLQAPQERENPSPKAETEKSKI